MAAPAPLRAPLMPLAGLAIVLVAAVAAFFVGHAMTAANQAINRSIEVRVGLAELGRSLAEHDADYRGYLIRDDTYQKRKIATTRAEVVARWRFVARNVASDREQHRRLEGLLGLVRDRIAYIDGRIRERERLGAPPPFTGAQLRSRSIVQHIHRALDDMSQREQARLERREDQAERLVSWLSLALAGTVLVVVLVAFLTVRDARQRFQALRNATRTARAATATAASEAAARAEAEAQLRQVQKVESLGQLTGGIAHDFNNMLAVISGGLELAQRRIADPGRAGRHIADAQEGTSRAAALVARLLAFSRRQPLAPTRIDTGDFLADNGELLRRVLGELYVVEVDHAADVWAVSADRAQLENALFNLAVNARDAMAGGGTVRLLAENLVVGRDRNRSDLPPGDYVALAVADAGAGMSAEILARAFDPFFTTKAVGRGTGLGLSQVFGFVRQSGGHVEIASTEGAGTRVTLLLPRAAADADAADEIVLPERYGAPAGERVLLVEDDDRVRRFSADALRELGYEAVAVAGAREALEALAAGTEVDVLFTDIVMPGMRGPELAAAVRAMRPGMPILFATGYARDPEDDALLAEIGAPILHKPFSMTALGEKLRQLLAART